jgi:16S rRNA (cytosine967-C5)-methyltransferase
MTSRPAKVTIGPARLAATDILWRVEAEGAYASVLIAAIPDSSLKHQDRALAQELVLGVLRRRKTLDYFIERYTGRSLDALDLQVVIALRLGLYQLRHLSRIPASAAVNDSVSLVRRARLASAASLVNAVLRRAARSLSDLPGEDLTDPIERLAVQVSHPRWMLQRWATAFGSAEAEALALANNRTPRVAFRMNTLRSTRDQAVAALQRDRVSSNPSSLVPGAFIAQPVALGSTVAARDGLIYIQDEASQLVSLLVNPESGQRILDLCAAPGSKTSHIAALTADSAWIVAGDLHTHRLATLASICKRLGVESVDVVALDATRGLPFIEAAGRFDRVLVDAPCSGTGTLAEHPEIKWRLSAAAIPRVAETQLELLRSGAQAVARGGRLVYSTCSVEAEENEGVVRRFLQLDSAFEIATPEIANSETSKPAIAERGVTGPDALADLITSDGFIRTFPHRHGCDGFFAAVLRRR